MKRLIFIGIFFLILAGFASAQTAEENATKWLSDHIVWSQASTEELSFATMVLNSQAGLSQLNSKMDSQNGCFPKTNCNVRDTALATLALESMNQEINKQLKYLSDSLKVASTNIDEWYIQVVANEEGACIIKYDEAPNGINFNFDDEGRLNDGSSWIRFNQLNGFIFNKDIEKINVACDFASVPKISAIKIIGNSYYIIEEQNSKNANFELKNGCYASSPSSGDCDDDSSFYASWVLDMLGSGITTENYLRDHADSNIEYALLSNINSQHIPNLLSRQMDDGSFGESAYESSFAYHALKNSNYPDESSRIKNWIETNQNRDGRFGSSIKDTSAALYLIYNNLLNDGDNEDESGGCAYFGCDIGYTCNPISGLCEPETLDICDRNGICNSINGENWTNCPTDCITPSSPGSGAICGDDICETGESINCPLDCTSTGDNDEYDNQQQETCGDFVCSFDEESSGSCPLDCETKKSSSSAIWIWIVIIILIIGGSAFFFLAKMKKKSTGERSPSYLNQSPQSYPQQPRQPQKPRRDDSMDDELDRSIKEAQDLLKKGK